METELTLEPRNLSRNTHRLPNRDSLPRAQSFTLHRPPHSFPDRIASPYTLEERLREPMPHWTEIDLFVWIRGDREGDDVRSGDGDGFCGCIRGGFCRGRLLGRYLFLRLVGCGSLGLGLADKSESQLQILHQERPASSLFRHVKRLVVFRYYRRHRLTPSHRLNLHIVSPTLPKHNTYHLSHQLPLPLPIPPHLRLFPPFTR